MREAPEHEPCRREQHQRHCHLPDDEAIPHHAPATRRGHPSSAFAQRVDVHRRPRERNEAEDQARDDRQGEREDD